MAFPGGAAAPAAPRSKKAPRPAAKKVADQRKRKINQQTNRVPKGRGPLPAPRRNPLYDPAQMLAGRSLKDAATDLTDLEIRPQVDALQRQIAENDSQGRAVQERIGGYFDAFNGMTRSALDGQRETSDRLNRTLADIGAEAQTAITAAGDRSSALTAPSAERGLDGGAFARLAAETAAQQQHAAQQASAARTFGATQGANYEGLTGSVPGVAALRGTEALRQASNAFALVNREPAAKIAELQGQRGAILTKNLGALRESERQNMLARDTLGLDAEKARLSASEKDADRQLRRQLARLSAVVTMRGQDLTRMIADRKFRLDVQKWGYEEAADRYMREHGLGRYRSSSSRRQLTPGQVNKAWASVDSAKSTATQLLEQGFDARTIRQALANGYYEAPVVDARGDQVYKNGVLQTKRYSVPRVDGAGYGVYANAALDIAIKGYLSPANVKALHRAGLRIGRRYPVYRRLPDNVVGPNRPA